MVRRAAWGLLALALVTAGCIGTQAPGEADGQAAETASVDGETLPSQAPAEGERGLDEPPTLREGEWWTVRLTSDTYNVDTEATVVAAGVEEGRYLIGMPADDYVPTALVLHLPGIGAVDPSTFGYEAHDATFEPMSFPLEEGRTWSTAWYSGDLEAEVVQADREEGRAVAELTGAENGTVTYEAGLGIPAKVALEGYGSYEVTDHGYGYNGSVKTPWATEIVLLHGRIGAGLDLGLQPAPPAEEVEVDGDYDEVAGALLLGNAVVDGPPGHYEVEATSPSGTTYHSVFRPTPTGPQLAMHPFTERGPVGTWEMTYVAGGPGVAAVEGMAYEVAERTLG